MEQYMDFEKRVQQVHKPDRVNPEAVRNLSGTKITEEWKIVCKEDADMVHIKSCPQGEISDVLRLGVIALSSTDSHSDIWRHPILSDHKSMSVQFTIH